MSTDMLDRLESWCELHSSSTVGWISIADMRRFMTDERQRREPVQEGYDPDSHIVHGSPLPYRDVVQAALLYQRAYMDQARIGARDQLEADAAIDFALHRPSDDPTHDPRDALLSQAWEALTSVRAHAHYAPVTEVLIEKAIEAIDAYLGGKP